MTKSEIKNLKERVESLTQKARPDKENENAKYDKIIAELSDQERAALSHAIGDAAKAGVNPDDEAWLVTRPQDQQTVVRKVASRFRELNESIKSDPS